MIMQCQNIQPLTASQPDSPISRRQLIINTLLVAGCISSSNNSEASSPKLDPAEPTAKNVGYVEVAAKVDAKKYPTYAKGQTCANCSLVQLRYGPLRPCSLFPGKMVDARGWCNAWSLRTFAK